MEFAGAEFAHLLVKFSLIPPHKRLLAVCLHLLKAISGQGEIDKPMPAAWADKHIVANVQKYMSGKFVLCKGNGSSEIADLK